MTSIVYGIAGYVGGNQATSILLNGLEKLEYRGYDPAGMVVCTEDALRVVENKGRSQMLSGLADGGKSLQGTVGISHTRWATHGKPSNINSHPQMSSSGRLTMMHNGIIENYQEVKGRLLEKSVSSISEIDTEVAAQLLKHYYGDDILDAFIRVISRLQDSYAPDMLYVDDPDKLYTIHKDSPLAVGLGEHENYATPDIPSILDRVHDSYRLKDNEIAQLTRDSAQICNLEKEPIEKGLVHIGWDLSIMEKSGYERFMFKEIMEQPKALRDTISPHIKDGRIVPGNVILAMGRSQEFNRVSVAVCGSAYRVGMIAKYVIEKLIRIPAGVDVTSKFRCRRPILDNNSLVTIISRSGETTNTLAAFREAKHLGARVISIVNVVGSSIASDSGDVLYTWVDPEIAVAATRAYNTQPAVVYPLAIYMADLLGCPTPEEYADHVKRLQGLPDKVKKTLENRKDIQCFTSKHFNAKNIFLIGRNLDYAIPLEGFLKLKKISYIRSEAYVAGELRYGTISLMEEGVLVVAIVTHQQLLEKVTSNMIEVRSRDALVLDLTTEDNVQEISKDMDFLFSVPTACEIMRPSLTVIPLQLFTCYMTSMKDCNIDKPRNLTKSVTVE